MMEAMDASEPRPPTAAPDAWMSTITPEQARPFLRAPYGTYRSGDQLPACPGCGAPVVVTPQGEPGRVTGLILLPCGQRFTITPTITTAP
jgi:hypothetical protein